MIWNGNFGFQDWLAQNFGALFHDFAGSMVVHGVGGWIALAAVLPYGHRYGRYSKDGKISFPASHSWPWVHGFCA